ncbi:MAG: N-acetylmuramoyl-L-alanine amidase LytC precursor, partial [Verrucomicrobiales bacterium]|nr:N-acetylmuramoyl-L-alanine amidase LytC precursor [Verrucomicrobiales bacterium]
MKIYHWAAGLALLSGLILEYSLGEETAVVTQKNVNVRGQPSLYSEVITHLKQGDKVTVLEEITPEKPKPGDPDKWARIKLPEDTHVWVFAPYVKDNAIAVPKLNLRGGPGENFSVLGRMQKGESIKPIRTLQDWIEIEAPTNSSAFIAFEVIKLTPAEPTATNVVDAAAGLTAPAVLPIKNQPVKTEPTIKQVEQTNPPSVTNTTLVTTNAVASAKPEPQKIETRK